MKVNAFLISALLAALCSAAVADDEAPNQPVVRSSEYGRVYAKSVPDEGYGQKGKTTVFRVGKERDTLICEYDWYASQIDIGGPGSETLVRFDPSHRGRKPQEDHLALGIYCNGKAIREYTTLEMQKLGSGVGESVSHYAIFTRKLGFRWMKGDDYVYEVEGVSGKVFSFDLSTGAIIERTPERAGVDKAIRVAVEKAATTLERPQDYRAISVAQRVLKDKYIWVVTFKPARLLPSDPSTERIGAGGELFVTVDVQTDAAEVRYGE